MRHHENSITARSLIVLDREARRAREATERVELVVAALAKRYGVAASAHERLRISASTANVSADIDPIF